MSEETTPKPQKPDPVKFSEESVLAALERMHPADDWAFFPKVRIGTGFGKDSQQEFDAWAIHYLKGKRNVAVCYEVKVSRSDFMSEIKKPIKRKAGLRLSHEFYFVTPKGMLKPEEIPPECGLIEVDEKGDLETVIQAPFRDTWPCSWLFVATLAKRLDIVRRLEWETEQKIKGIVMEREVATRAAIDRHIKRWQEHNIGSREIPDRILDALEDLKRDVDYAIRANKQIR